MSKKLLLIFFVTLFSTKIFPQIIQNYGLKIGYVNSSQTYTNKVIDDITKRKSGFSFSAFVDLFNFDGFSISPEIKYIQKGVGLDMVVTGPEGPEQIGKKTEYIYHNYLSIPVSLVYKIQLAAGIPYVKIAPRYDILLSSDDDFNSPASTYEGYKNVFGGTVSIGFIPNLKILINPFVEISYHMDFTDTYSGTNNKIKNNAVEINLGIMF